MWWVFCDLDKREAFSLNGKDLGCAFSGFGTTHRENTIDGVRSRNDEQTEAATGSVSTSPSLLPASMSSMRSRSTFSDQENVIAGFYPCASLNVGQAVRFNFGHTPFLHPPSAASTSASFQAAAAGFSNEENVARSPSESARPWKTSSLLPVRALSDAAAFSAGSAALAHQALLGLGRSSLGFTGYHISSHYSPTAQKVNPHATPNAAAAASDVSSVEASLRPHETGILDAEQKYDDNGISFQGIQNHHHVGFARYGIGSSLGNPYQHHLNHQRPMGSITMRNGMKLVGSSYFFQRPSFLPCIVTALNASLSSLSPINTAPYNMPIQLSFTIESYAET